MSTFDARSTAEQVSEGIDLRGKTWLVTGCNSGIGLETARVLSLRGAHVVGAARTLEKAKEALAGLPNPGSPLACELSDLGSVRGAVEAIRSMGTALDGVIANAGIMALPKAETKYGLELQFLTNHVGHFALVTGIDDLMTDLARVVVVSSGAHRYASERGLELDNLDGATDYEPWRMYGRSKLANILFARTLAHRFAKGGSQRTAFSLHPGVIRTNLTRHIADVDTLLAPMKSSMKTVAQGAATQVYVATQPGLEAHSGAYFSDCAVARTIPSGTDDALGEVLWGRTETLLAALG
ncbi:MAG: SDR family NAD(P)-dependent oxidoreductase [Deltaproteobacteria bacterium]|nr:SDR family NAD(P)-dependent oxidoreductase [Deltaproteobacteria bacterium]